MTRHSVLTIVIALCIPAGVGAMSFGQALQPAPAAPSGWKKSVDSSKKATAFTKTGLGKDGTLAVKFYPRKVLETNQNLEQWLVFRLATGRPPKSGKWVGPPIVIRQTGNMIEGSREYLVDGQAHSIRGLAVGVDNMHVRFGAILASDTTGSEKAKRESEKLLYQLFKVENEAAIKDSRGVNIELNPPKVKNLKAGGAIKPGRYVGNAVYLKDKKAGQVYDLVMHVITQRLRTRKRRRFGSKELICPCEPKSSQSNGFDCTCLLSLMCFNTFDNLVGEFASWRDDDRLCGER